MRVLIIFFVGMMFTLQSCEKDPVFESQICKPESRPEISDTGNHKNLSKIKGDWQLTNTVSYEDEEFLKYRELEGFLKNNNLARKPILRFKNQNKLLDLELVNQCHFNYYLNSKNDNNWLHINWKNTLGCTAKGPPNEISDWENNYNSAIMNSTCYKIKKEKLIIQYHISEDKNGKLIYKKVD